METNKQYLFGGGAILVVLLSLYVAILSVKEWKSVRYIGGENSQGYITVSGEGEVVAVPDLATFTFSAVETAKTVNVARDAATLSINKALEIVKKAGVPESDIKTAGYSISPKYEYSGGDCNEYRCTTGKQTFVGYEVNQTIEVKVRDLNKVGQLFADVSASGVKQLGNIAFTVESQELLKEKARNEAITKARKQADDLADSLGVKLVRITSFNEGGVYPVPYYAKGGDMMASVSARPEAAPSVPVGEQKIVSNVSITYQIR
jgi:uncharacterized protein YggE